MKIIPYGRQQITDEDILAVNNVLRSDLLTQGPAIQAFENAFASYCGSNYAIALSNGTTALHLAALALGVNGSSNVITSPITFVASANCVRYCGGTVWFADIDPVTYTMDIGKVRQLIASKPKGFFQGIIPVDFAGFAVNLEELRALADEHGLWIIEDACHSPGGYFTDKSGKKQVCGNGKFAEISVFSFHPVKHIACGEGGMITTDNKELYEKIMLLRTHGITKDPQLLEDHHGGWYYEMQQLGYNYRLTDFQSALGLSQLGRAENGMERRKAIARKYNETFTNMPGIVSHSGLVTGHAYHLYIIEVNDRKALYDFLKEKNIYTQVHYIPVHTMPYYKQFGWKQGDFPSAEQYYNRCLSLPMYPALSDEEQDYVITSIKTFFA
ncbi:UDP-4-amino-4,6-dideoxy-N-acetyl-beta-L-altrosamine transaminase [Sediminibacterium roseum]|uniref:UDP-4-amino-4, 6-dideoxy-N-acetyl-beta-L-altrosamine transaminase n=1 Tax=Sediminibacterium roseum TaxID=1978412 RepID=A0ABW9ZPN8_9BACT|nr:UDP-4-amino-4,6-dideoxy-N-acetyl-beta-L-altrosamine transaminase [Sediminibacterium roseum]NCI49066.1 UDP-4-amino-4,6-dideoxy-N-acetyl-beta-L-altrosamine transaminase [Sediminibacterium roseum]